MVKAMKQERIFGLVLFCACLALTVQAAPSVSIQDTALAPGGSGTVAVNITDVANLGTVQLDIGFDPGVVQVTGVGSGDFDVGGEGLANIDNAGGTVRLGAMQLGSAGLDGTVLVCTLTLEAVGSAGASSPLTILKAELTEDTPATTYIQASLDGGLITIAGAQTASLTPTPDNSGGSDPGPTPTEHAALITSSLQAALNQAGSSGTISIRVTGNLAALIEYLDTGDTPYTLTASANTVSCSLSPADIRELAEKSFVTSIDLNSGQAQEQPAATATTASQGSVSGTPAPEETAAASTAPPTATQASVALAEGTSAAHTSAAAPGFSIWLALCGMLLFFCIFRR